MWAEAGTQAMTVGAEVAAMDRRSHEGLTTGMVTLPRRAVHLGVWLRMLRTPLDEVNTPTSQVRQAARTAIQRIWATIGRPARDGQLVWRPYEALTWPHQQAMLEATATALSLVETGDITARGSLGPLLRAEPYRPAAAGPPPSRTKRPEHLEGLDGPAPEPNGLWNEVMDAVQDAITEAQTDPGAASRLLRLFTYPCKTPAAFDRIRDNLVNAGVPVCFLPTYQADQPDEHRRCVTAPVSLTDGQL